jgi:hypothetical protein
MSAHGRRCACQFCRSGPNTARQLGELATARALSWVLKARQNGYYAPEVEQRYQDANDVAESAITRYAAELTILGEGQDPIGFATDVLRGAIAAAVFVESAPRPRCAAEEMLSLLHSAPPGQSQN